MRADAFGKAQRHSRKVRFLKVAVPVLAIAIAIAFPAYSYLVKPAPVPVKAEGQAFSDGKLVMANPKLDGFTKQNLPYSMKAVRAVQDVARQGVIELEGINAKLPVNDKVTASVDAARGVYDRDGNTLNLTGDVTVTTTDGMVAKFKSAFLEIGKGDMKTDQPVDISSNGSRVTSDSLTVQDGGKVLVFEKRVRVNLDPARLKTEQEKSGDQNAVN